MERGPGREDGGRVDLVRSAAPQAQTHSGADPAHAREGRADPVRSAAAKVPSVPGLDFPRYFTLPGVDSQMPEKSRPSSPL